MKVFLVVLIMIGMITGTLTRTESTFHHEPVDKVKDVVKDVAKETGRVIKDVAKETVRIVKDVGDGTVEIVCDMVGKEPGKDCHVGGGISINQDGDVKLTDGEGNPVPQRPTPQETEELADRIRRQIIVIDPGTQSVTFNEVSVLAEEASQIFLKAPETLTCKTGRCLAYFDGTIDLVSLKIGIDEFNRLEADDKWWDYVVVGTGIAADAGMLVLPGTIGASILIKAVRISDKTLDKIPADWVVRRSRKGNDVKFQPPDNPHTYVRIKGENQEMIRVQKNGKALGRDGNVVPAKSKEAHMNLEEFENFPSEVLKN